jgi:hypothetical protein
VDRRQVAQGRLQWRVLVNTVTKFQIPENAGISLLDENLLAYHEGLCSMELVRDELTASLLRDFIDSVKIVPNMNRLLVRQHT